MSSDFAYVHSFVTVALTINQIDKGDTHKFLFHCWENHYAWEDDNDKQIIVGERQCKGIVHAYHVDRFNRHMSRKETERSAGLHFY